MKKETIKSLILALLILNCFILTTQIWLDRRIWGDSLSVDAIISKLPISFLRPTAPSQQSSVMRELLSPRFFLVGDTSGRNVMYKLDAGYAEAIAVYDDALRQAMTAAAQSITPKEYKAMLEGQCLYAHYGFAVDSTLLAEQYGIAAAELPFAGARDVVLAVDSGGDSVSLAVWLDDGAIFKFGVDVTASELAAVVNLSDKRKVFEFGYELNLDNENAVGFAKPVQPSAFVLFEHVARELPKIEPQPIVLNEQNVELYGAIVEAFGYRPSNLRRSYSDGAVNYVENNGTVSISASGAVKYSAVTGDNGIDIGADYRQQVGGVLALANNIYSLTQSDSINVCAITDMLRAKKGNDYTLELYYSVNGIPNTQQKAVQAEVKNGKLVSFELNLVSFTSSGRSVCARQLQALDNYFASNMPETTAILSGLSLCYNDNTPTWLAMLDNNPTVLEEK